MDGERPGCPACGQPVETVVRRHKTLGAWVPVRVRGPCRNPRRRESHEAGESGQAERPGDTEAGPARKDAVGQAPTRRRRCGMGAVWWWGVGIWTAAVIAGGGLTLWLRDTAEPPPPAGWERPAPGLPEGRETRCPVPEPPPGIEDGVVATSCLLTAD